MNAPDVLAMRMRAMIKNGTWPTGETGCQWLCGGPCHGAVHEEVLFTEPETKGSPMPVNVCRRHYEIHKLIMSLWSKGHDFEMLIGMGLHQLKELDKGEICPTWSGIA